jgi:hypothetical protein
MKEWFSDDIWSDVWYEVPATPKKGGWQIFREEQKKTVVSKEIGKPVLPKNQEQKLEDDIGKN